MRKFTKKKNGSYEIMLVAENEEEYSILADLYDNNLVFGSYLLYTHEAESKVNNKYYKFMETHFPDGKGLMIINVVSTFVNAERKKV